jgi:LytS/YehU family sensor histidine kinase
MELIANEKPMVAAQSMKKIRHLLLYILYENTSSKVPLNKEIALLQEYVDLEKLTAEKEVNVVLHIGHMPVYETIAPFILLPLVENAFKQLSSYPLKNPNLFIDISFRNEMIDVKLQWDKPIETSSLNNGRNIILQNISKKLQLIYPQSHDLKMMIETNKICLDLSIHLRKAIN